jgi:hypothetical protein
MAIVLIILLVAVDFWLVSRVRAARWQRDDANAALSQERVKHAGTVIALSDARAATDNAKKAHMDAAEAFLKAIEEAKEQAHRRETALKVEIEALKNENNRLTVSSAVMGRNEAAAKEIDSFKKDLVKNPRLDGVLRGKTDG